MLRTQRYRTLIKILEFILESALLAPRTRRIEIINSSKLGYKIVQARRKNGKIKDWYVSTSTV